MVGYKIEPQSKQALEIVKVCKKFLEFQVTLWWLPADKIAESMAKSMVHGLTKLIRVTRKYINISS
jgi:hypothetical protein